MSCNQCCCTCRNRFKLMKHPVNTPTLKGSIKEQVVIDDSLVYICTAQFEDGSNAGEAYATKPHGLCEFYSPQIVRK